MADKLLTMAAVGVGGYLIYDWLFAPKTAVQVDVVPGLPAPAVAPPLAIAAPHVPADNVPVPAAAPVPGGNLDAVYSRLKAAAAGDTNFAGSGDSMAGTPYHWDFYLKRVLPGGSMDAPVSSPDLGTVFPGVDLGQPMTAVVFWAGEARAVGATSGMSGLLAGLGDFCCSRGLMGLGYADLRLKRVAGGPIVLKVGERGQVPLFSGGLGQLVETFDVMPGPGDTGIMVQTYSQDSPYVNPYQPGGPVVTPTDPANPIFPTGPNAPAAPGFSQFVNQNASILGIAAVVLLGFALVGGHR